MKLKLNQNDASLEQLFNDFLTSCKVKGLSSKTLASYASHMQCIGKYLDLKMKISDLNSTIYESMISEMVDNNLAPNSIRSYQRVLSSFMTWANQNGFPTIKITPLISKEKTI